MTGSGRSLRILLAALLATGLLGLLASAALAADPGWTRWTVSQLTADPGASAVFRATMLGLGTLLVLLAAPVTRLVTRLRATDAASVAAWLLPGALIVAAAGFVGVAVFPLDVAPLVTIAHGTAAYVIPMSGLALMLGARLVVPGLGDRFGRASLAAIAGILALYVAAIAGAIGYAVMELAAFGLAGAWLAWLVLRLEAVARGATSA
jgi:hypothetical protein